MPKITVNEKPKGRRGRNRSQKIRTEAITIDLDPARRIERASIAMAELMRERIGQETRVVKPQTVERRARARKSVSSGSAPATARRYRKGAPQAASTNRWLNDSGQLAASIQSKTNKRGKTKIKARYAKRALYLGQLHKTIDVKTARKHPRVIAALKRDLQRAYKKQGLR